MDLLVNIYVFKPNSKFYASEEFLMKDPSPISMLEVKDYFINEYDKYKGMHLVIVPDDVNSNFPDAYPLLILNEDRKYGM